jgi:hypothetical protein
MLREIKGTQRLARFIGFKVTGTGTAAITQGAQDATLTDNGVGDYTLTFAKAFTRAPIVVASALTADTYAEVAAASTSSCQIKIKAPATGAATDAVFFVQVLGYDSADET